MGRRFGFAVAGAGGAVGKLITSMGGLVVLIVGAGEGGTSCGLGRGNGATAAVEAGAGETSTPRRWGRISENAMVPRRSNAAVTSSFAFQGARGGTSLTVVPSTVARSAFVTGIRVASRRGG